MKRIKIIGLTGQSGAGKSTVAYCLEQKGFAVINADRLVAELYNGGSVCLTAVASVFGKDILNPDGTPNRVLLAKRAFSSKDNTELLGRLVHPFVTALFFEKLKKLSGADAVVYDAPQLFESNADVLCDVIVSVVADRNVRLKRICDRDNMSCEQALQRINAQYGEEFFRKNSDFVVENNNTKEELIKNISNIISQLETALHNDTEVM